LAPCSGNPEDGADGNVGVDVGGPVEGIEDQEVFAQGENRGNLDDIRILLGGHGAEDSGPFHAVDENPVGKLVELADFLSLDIDLPVNPRMSTNPALLTSREMILAARMSSLSRVVRRPVAWGASFWCKRRCSVTVTCGIPTSWTGRAGTFNLGLNGALAAGLYRFFPLCPLPLSLYFL